MFEGGPSAAGLFSDPASAAGDCRALLSKAIVRRRTALGRPIVAGLCGPQGSGKSTMAAWLARSLSAQGHRAVALSLDDFYLTRPERIELARAVHALFIARGVPGTHDIGLALRTLDQLLDPTTSGQLAVPTFDKLLDDRAPEASWRQVEAPFDVVVLEGWCVGARPQPAQSLVGPTNDLERSEDADALWRTHVNRQLSGVYQKLFARLDLRILLRAPFEHVERWRAEQEGALARSAAASAPPMDHAALQRFVAHYERLTRWINEDQPADLVIELDSSRVPTGIHAGFFMTS